MTGTTDRDDHEKSMSDRPSFGRRAFALSALAVSVCCHALPARAQTAAESALAEKLFAEATTLVANGSFAEACPKLEESQRLDPAIGTQYNLALCYEQIGRLGSAWRNLRTVQRDAHKGGKKGREDAAVEKMQELRSRVPHLVVTAKDTDVTLKVDGERIERDDWPFVAVDPGEHVVEATAPAKKPWSVRVVVPESAERGAEQAVVVPPLAVAEGRVVTVTKETANTKRTIGFVVGGVGVVGVGAAAVTGVLLLGKHATAKDHCAPNCVDQEGVDAVSAGKTLLPINLVAWIVAGVGLGAGSFLVLTSPPKKPTSTRVEAVVGPRGVGLEGIF
jgi:hypothetical protein